MKYLIATTCLLIGLITGTALGVSVNKWPYKKTGILISKKPNQDQTSPLTLYRHSVNESQYILKISRNSLDSKFMTEETKLSGWFDIPIPIPFVSDIRKKYVVYYRDSDKDWDYFTLILKE